MLCPNCNNDCSNKATFCPQCGEPFTPIIPPIEKTHGALFAFFLGALGIHDFILGNPGRGFFKLALTFSSFLILPYFIWGIINYLDLRHIYKGTYPTKTKKLTGDDSIPYALSVIFLVLFIISNLGIISVLGFLFFPALFLI